MTKYHTLMGSGTVNRDLNGPTVAELLNHYIAWNRHNRARATTAKIQFHVQRFVKHIGDSLTTDRLKPHHVQAWIDNRYRGKSDTYKHTAMSVIQGALNWSREHGYIDNNALQRMRKPKPSVREFFVKSDDWDKLIEACLDVQLKDVVECMLLTGARPQEIRHVEARHYDPRFCRLVFPIVESKGNVRQRVIYLNPTAREIVERRILEHPTGPIFRNSRGGPWTKDALAGRFRRLKREVAMAGLCAYSLRHSFAHWQLTSDTDSHIVSKLLGHIDGRMLHTRYGHVDQDATFMNACVNRVPNPLGKR